MNKSFFAEALQHQPAFIHALLAYNSTAPAPPAELAHVPARLWGTAAVQRHFPAAQQEKAFWDFVEEPRRIAFLPEESLLRLALCCGITLHATAFAHCLLRTERQAIIDDLGADALQYAFTRGRFRQNSLCALFQPWHKELALAQRARVHGAWAIQLLIQPWPQALLERFMPRWQAVLALLCHGISPTSVPLEPAFLATWQPEHASLLWFSLKKLLLQEVDTAWAPCFA
jgi:hypothetical protein